MSIYSTYKNIESPLNYSGGKFKMLNFIQENLPDNINTFVDLFGGGFNVGVNIINANSIIYNDYNIYVKNLIKKLYTTDIDYIFSYIEGFIKKYNLSYGSSGYYDLRKFYNSVEI
jgi:adenine-specific DNA-methyltransferase